MATRNTHLQRVPVENSELEKPFARLRQRPHICGKTPFFQPPEAGFFGLHSVPHGVLFRPVCFQGQTARPCKQPIKVETRSASNSRSTHTFSTTRESVGGGKQRNKSNDGEMTFNTCYKFKPSCPYAPRSPPSFLQPSFACFAQCAGNPSELDTLREIVHRQSQNNPRLPAPGLIPPTFREWRRGALRFIDLTRLTKQHNREER